MKFIPVKNAVLLCYCKFVVKNSDDDIKMLLSMNDDEAAANLYAEISIVVKNVKNTV